jgi:hypothetical protein
MTTVPYPIKPVCLPPAPANGGPLESAPPKIGEWVWQPKIDDRRVVIHCPSRTVWNQYGELSIAMRDGGKFQKALGIICEQMKRYALSEWLDAGLMEYRHDMMRGCIIVFDLIQATDYYCRRDQLNAMFPVLPDDMATALATDGGQIRDQVYLINDFTYFEEPLKLQENLKAQNARIGHKFYEGLVAKQVKAPYPYSQAVKNTTPYWIKHRFDQ